MYADIIVDKPSDPSKPYFTYLVPKHLEPKLKIGQYLLLPWGKTESKGIVVGIKNKADIVGPKPISKILIDEPILKPNQLKLLSWLCYYYAAPVLDCMRLFLPGFPADLTKIKLNPNPNGFGQKLILVPNLTLLPYALTKIKPKNNFATYHYDLPKSKKYSVWQETYNGQTQTIVGSRSSLFLPFTNLSEILLINEHDWGYKDERSPYYHGFTVAYKLAQIVGSKLVVDDKTPSIELFYFAKSLAKDTKLTLLQEKFNTVPTSKVVDMSSEKISGNYSPISTFLANCLLVNSRKKLWPVLLFLNRKTEAGNVYCRVCKQTSPALLEPVNCPNCQSPDIIFSSLNLKLIAKEVQKIIPQTTLEIVEEGYKKPIPQAQITIATSAIFYLPVVSAFTQIAMISADIGLNLGDFRSQENTFQLIHVLTLLPLTKTSYLPRLVIQTYNPNLPAIKYALLRNYQSFYDTEILQRKEIGYPPFAKFVKLSIFHKYAKQAQQLADKLYQELEELNIPNVDISEPLKSQQKLPRKDKWNIILKAKTRSDFNPVLANVPKNWTINVDPKDLL